MADRAYLPRVYRDFRRDHRDIAVAYDRLGDVCRQAGSLALRDQRLVKLGIAIGLSSEGAVRSHVRRGLAEGLTPDEVVHAITLGVPTVGFPATAAAYRGATEVLESRDAVDDGGSGASSGDRRGDAG